MLLLLLFFDRLDPFSPLLLTDVNISSDAEEDTLIGSSLDEDEFSRKPSLSEVAFCRKPPLPRPSAGEGSV